GAFATAASEGAYEVRVYWDNVNSAEELDFGWEGTSRTFVAEFFDQAGHRTSRETTLHLECEFDEQLPCHNGMCQRLDSLDDCGECGNQCDASGMPALQPMAILRTFDPLACAYGAPEDSLAACAYFM